MRRFMGQGLLYAVATVLVVLSVNAPFAEARNSHSHKPPKDAPGLELPILASMSTLGYAGYYYVKSRKR